MAGIIPSRRVRGTPFSAGVQAADAKAYTAHPQPTVNTYKIVRGEQVKWAHHDPRPCQMPPDWSGGYTSIYAAQAGEDKG